MRQFPILLTLAVTLSTPLFSSTDTDLKCVCACKDNVTKMFLAASPLKQEREIASVQMHFAEDTSVSACHKRKDSCSGFSLKNGDNNPRQGTLSCALIIPSRYQAKR